MHIIQFKAQKTKNLNAIEINPDGNPVILSGKNGQGKSNTLNVIKSTLTGERLEDPIKHGEEKAEAFIDCGEFKVRKRWTAKGEYIQVIMANGDVKSKPMEFLASMIGKISFDPLAFKDMSPKEQRELLKNLVGLDFTDIQKEYKEVFEKRSEVNSQIKGVIAQLDNTEAPHPDTADEEISFKEELDKITQMRDKQKVYLDSLSKREDIKELLSDCLGSIEHFEVQIKSLQESLETAKENSKNLSQKIDQWQLPEEVTSTAILAVESSLQDIESKNVNIRAAKRYRSLIKDSNKLKEQSDKHTEHLNRLEQDKATRIANAKFPIEGMAMDDEDVIYKGKKFSILSDGEQIRVSTAMAMALNPNLKVIFIHHGNDLDSDGKKEIFDLAKSKGFDIWMEVVDESGDLGYFIEDGNITAVNGVKVEVSTENTPDHHPNGENGSEV